MRGYEDCRTCEPASVCRVRTTDILHTEGTGINVLGSEERELQAELTQWSLQKYTRRVLSSLQCETWSKAKFAPCVVPCQHAQLGRFSTASFRSLASC